MPTFTNNHSFGRPTEGGDTDDWGRILNEDLIDLLEQRVVIVDTDANRSNYTPYTDAIYITSDTNQLYRGDGASWNVFNVEPVDHATTHESGGSDPIDHGSIDGLADDDHTQYLLVDGTRAMSGALDMGGNALSNASNGTFSGTVTASTEVVTPLTDTNEVQNQDYNETVNTQTAQSGTVTVDLSVANFHEVEADGDITISFSNVTSSPPGNSLTIYLYDDDATGPHTITWPASVEWSKGKAETEIPSGGDIEISLLTPDGGTTWRARLSGEAFA